MKQFDKIVKITQIIILLMLFALGTTQFILTNNLVIYGGQITHDDQTLNSVKRENILLVKQLAQDSSIAELSTKAKLLGFVQPSTILTLTAEYSVAIRP
jgi:hypothetical protein